MGRQTKRRAYPRTRLEVPSGRESLNNQTVLGRAVNQGLLINQSLPQSLAGSTQQSETLKQPDASGTNGSGTYCKLPRNFETCCKKTIAEPIQHPQRQNTMPAITHQNSGQQNSGQQGHGQRYDVAIRVANRVATLRSFPQLLACLVLGFLSTGCASLTNPTANGVPVRILPEELLAESKEGLEPIPLTLFRQEPPEQYLLEPGDTLGIYIEGILGNEETPPPVHIPDSSDQPPSIGYPFPIRKDGTISLPYVGKVNVAKPALEKSITVEEAEERVVEAYRVEDILRVESKRVLVSLMRPRYVRVLVMRPDPSRSQVSVRNSELLGLGSRSTTIGGGRSNVGQILELPANENDILNALARTGGIPGPDTTQEIIIQRGFWNAKLDPTASQCAAPNVADLDRLIDSDRHITRIPLLKRCDEPICFGPKDVILNDGDILIVRSRKPEFFYTGGIMPSREIGLPYDYDLTVVEAVLRANGPLFNGGINSRNLNGSIVGAGVGNPSPSLVSVVRKMPMGGQVTIRVDLNEAIRDPRQNLLVKAEDLLILQEAPNEAVTRYFSQVFQANFFGRFIDRGHLKADASIVLP